VLPITAKQVADGAGYLLLAVTAGFFFWLFFVGHWTPAERKRLYAIAFFFLAAAVFWSEFEQAGSTLNLFADRATRTSFLGWTFPSSYFQSAEPVFIILFAPIFAWLWLTLGRRDPSTPVKFGAGLICVGAGFAVLAIAATLSANGVRVSRSGWS
jgi:POT family proton-dependent oligopeptide transporter